MYTPEKYARSLYLDGLYDPLLRPYNWYARSVIAENERNIDSLNEDNRALLRKSNRLGSDLARESGLRASLAIKNNDLENDNCKKTKRIGDLDLLNSSLKCETGRLHSNLLRENDLRLLT